MSLSHEAVRLIDIAATLTGFFAVYVGHGVKRLWPDTLPGHIAAWGTPITCLLCCATVVSVSWLEQPHTAGSWFVMGLAVSVTVIILLFVYLYRWEKKHADRAEEAGI